MAFVYALNKIYDETFTSNWVGTDILSSALLTGSTSRFKLETPAPISGATRLITLTYTVDGILNGDKSLKVYLKYKKAVDIVSIPCSQCVWSDLMLVDTLSGNTGVVERVIYLSGLTGISLNPTAPLDMEISFLRVDEPSDSITSTYISNVIVSGEYKIEYTDEFFVINDGNPEMILKPSDIYKVFSVDDFQVVYYGNIDDVIIRYRVTQDGGRTYSNWEMLTKENISTYRFNELRFARVEYLVVQSMTGSPPVKIYDILLIGDFQNVSDNYLKLNRYGLKEDCLAKYLKDTGQAGAGDVCAGNYMGVSNGVNPTGPGYDYGKDFYTQGLSCYQSVNTIQTVMAENADNKDGYWDPYDTNKITQFYNMLSNQVSDILGWEVDYHRVDADQNGIDMFLHENQLINVVDLKKLKVLVPDNKFPDNTVVMNSFNLDLFDTFEIHVLKDEFKNKFGIEQRPLEKDIVYFCQINRLFYIRHAQIFRDIMNAGIYYKIILEKYEQKANYQNLSEESSALLNVLTKDTTMDELFGEEIEAEMDKVANLDQTYPLTFEKMRESMFSKVVITDTHLNSGDMKVAESFYNFKDCVGKIAITYKKVDKVMKKSDNRSFSLWFNFNNACGTTNNKDDIFKGYFVSRKNVFNLLDNYDSGNKTGYKINYQNGEIVLQFNDQYYSLNDLSLNTNIWYQLVINFDQRQRELDMYLYKRDSVYKTVLMRNNHELASVVSTNDTGYTYLVNAGYKPIDNQEQYSTSTDFNLISNITYEFTPMDYTHAQSVTVTGSDIKYTNLRIFNDIIPLASIGNILNQLIVTDTNHLLLADNAYRKLYVPENYPISKNQFD